MSRECQSCRFFFRTWVRFTASGGEVRGAYETGRGECRRYPPDPDVGGLPEMSAWDGCTEWKAGGGK